MMVEKFHFDTNTLIRTARKTSDVENFCRIPLDTVWVFSYLGEWPRRSLESLPAACWVAGAFGDLESENSHMTEIFEIYLWGE